MCTACYLLLPYMRCDLWSNRTQAIDTLTPGHCQSYPATLYRDSWIPVERSTDGVYTGVSTTTSRMTLSSTSGTKLLRVRSGVRLIIQPFFATKHWHLVAKVVRRNILKIHVNAYLRLTIPTLRSIRIWMIDIHHSLNYIRENAESRVSIGISTTEVA